MEPVRPNELKALTDVYLESLLEDLPSEEEIASQQVLSGRFLYRMDCFTGKNRRTPRTWKKKLLVAAIVGAILATTVSVYAKREVIAEFCISVYEKYSEIFFPSSIETDGTSDEKDPESSLTENLPYYIPTGYHETERMILTGMIQITYIDANGDVLLFGKVLKSGLHMIINTEGIMVEEITINGIRGLYYSNVGLNSLVWSDNTYAYIVTGITTKQEMIDLAISTK